MGLIPKIVCISDLHFGHARVPSTDTANDIRTHLFPMLDDSVDILFICGDVFDRLISMNQNDSLIVLELFSDLALICLKHNIILRIVRGTFSHDHRQIDFISRLYSKRDIQIDYKLFDVMNIEYIEKYEVYILYMPDNLPFGTKGEIFDHIRMLLRALAIDKVDYVILHGELNHLVFGHINTNAFAAYEFESICNKYVFAGHIHKPLLYKNTVSIGSFNRLAHNEEEQKGFWIIDDKPRFIPNKSATIFKTLDFTNVDTVEKLIERYTNVVKSFDKDRLSFVRIIIKDIHLKHTLSRYNDTQYPNVRLSFKTSAVKDDRDNNFLNEKLSKKQTIQLEVPSLENVSSIVFNNLQIKGIYIDIQDIRQIIHNDILGG